MRIAQKYNGKWIATKNGKVIASADSYNAVKAKVQTKNDNEKIYFGLVPSTPHFIGS